MVGLWPHHGRDSPAPPRRSSQSRLVSGLVGCDGCLGSGAARALSNREQSVRQSMNSPEQKLLTAINSARGKLRRPIVVALDGGSGAGKSTIAERLMRHTDVALVRLDDFYQTLIPESQLPHQTVEQRLNGVFDWARVRSEALEPLRAGRPGRWHAFDFVRGLGERGTYSLNEQMTNAAPAPTIPAQRPH